MPRELRRIFEPITIGPRTARNRIASTPHTTGFAENGMPTERYARYHAEKAKGGAGLVMTFGSCSVHPASPPEGGGVTVWDDSVIPYLARVAELVHEHEAVLISQISHRGRRSTSTMTERPLLAPSDIPEPTHREVPHEIEIDQIEEVIKSFAQAAVRFQMAGFDGVEINSFGGQLIEQFWSPLMNRRTDEWGGSIENRMRFGMRVVESVRSAVGSDFVVGFRMTADEMLEGGLKREELQEIAHRLDALGKLDYFSITGGVGATLKTQAATVASMDFPHLLFIDLAKSMKDVISVPVLYAGRVLSPIEAEGILERNEADIVAMTRAMIADPHLVNKARDGQLSEIRPCVGANEGCIGRRFSGLHVSCVHNPVVGREAELADIRPAASSKRVIVVGGGPAGLEAARVAALRGHRVTLIERDPKLGGQIMVAAKAPNRQEYAGVVVWLERQVQNVVDDIRLGTEATADSVLALGPEVVVVATGSKPRIPEFLGADLPHVVSVNDILSGRHQAGQRCIIVDDDGHLRGPSTADFLSAQGKHVSIVTRLWSVGDDIDMTLKPVIYERLFKQGVEMIPHMTAVATGPGWVRLKHVFTEVEQTIDNIDTVVTAYGGKAHDDVYHALKSHGPELRLIGDAMAPRRLADAMLEATRTARAI